MEKKIVKLIIDLVTLVFLLISEKVLNLNVKYQLCHYKEFVMKIKVKFYVHRKLPSVDTKNFASSS